MDEWGNYMKNTNEYVFEIKNLIKITAIDHPNDFQEKRDKLAEELFTCDLTSVSRVNKEDNELAEVLRIKGVLEKGPYVLSPLHQTLNNLFEVDMRLSYKTLEATKIGITVNALKKHESKVVKQTAKVMIRDWKRMVDEYLDGDGKKSVVVLEEEECGELNKNNVKPVNGNDMVAVLMSEQKTRNIHEDESKSESRSVLLESSWKPRELNRNTKLQTDQQRKKAMNVEAATLKNQKVSSSNLDEKLVAWKRKLQPSYKEEEFLKKKQIVQVLEFHELSKHEYRVCVFAEFMKLHTKYVTGCEMVQDCLLGRAGSHLRVRSCTKQSDWMNSCTSKGIQLALLWGWIPRLDSGVRTAKVMIRDWKRMLDEYLDGDGKKSVVVLEEEECGELNKNNVKPVNGNERVALLMSKQKTRNIV
nr:transcription elongation factor, TFIIS/CRSP70 [Tanacetum cinerariifolium]